MSQNESANQNKNTTCRACGGIFPWDAARLMGYQAPKHLGAMPLELRECPITGLDPVMFYNGRCGNTLAREVAWAVVTKCARDAIRANFFAVTIEQSALMALVNELESVAPMPSCAPGRCALAASRSESISPSGTFTCAHGRTLDERCLPCERPPAPASSRVGKLAASRGRKGWT